MTGVEGTVITKNLQVIKNVANKSFQWTPQQSGSTRNWKINFTERYCQARLVAP